MAAYLVFDCDWKDTDIEDRKAYARAAQPVIQRYGGTFVTPTGRPGETLEGDWNPVILTIVEFPDADTARQLWNDPDFRTAVTARQATSAVFKVVLVDAAPA